MSSRVERDRTWFRIWVAAVFALATLTTLWLAGSLAWDLRDGNVHATTLATVCLVAISGSALTAFLLRWAPAIAEEPKSELFRALLGDNLQVRNQARFLARMRFQRERALQDPRACFSLLVVRFYRELSFDEQKSALACVRTAIRSKDVIGDPGGGEIWALLNDASPEGAHRTSDRLTRIIGELADSIDFPAIGWSTLRVDGRDEKTLLRVARLRLSESGGHSRPTSGVAA